MAKTRKRPRAVRGDDLLESAGVSSRSADYKPAAVIFAQGEPGTTVMFIKRGTVTLSVVSRGRRQSSGC